MIRGYLNLSNCLCRSIPHMSWAILQITGFNRPNFKSGGSSFLPASLIAEISKFYRQIFNPLVKSVSMSSARANQTSQDQTPPTHHHQQIPSLRCRRLLFSLWASSLLILILSFSLNEFNPFPLSLKAHLPLLKPTILLKNLRPLNSPPRTRPRPIWARPPCVLWMAPFVSPGGYSSEAWSYIKSLATAIDNPDFAVTISHHGDLQSYGFWRGLPETDKALAHNLYNTECELNETVVVCHSEPGAWYPPLFETLPCPPTGYGDPLSVVGRTMFETDRLSEEHVRRCNRMDTVWVPTEFHVSAFVRSGVDPSKVVKLVQPVDIEFFDPAKHRPLALDARNPILGSRGSDCEDQFVFLSVFKWEQRKGWDVLLRAFLGEFCKKDRVALYLLVSAYHSDTDFAAKILKFAEGIGLQEPADGWAPVHVINKHVPQVDLPRIYKAADAFVLPTRGEGWGRPIVEAMAMGLPVIATNWSGPTEYLTEENGYPLAVDEMSEVVDGPFKGHRWAEPSSDRLRVLMRRVVSDREEGMRKGRRAREDMITRFSPEVVARVLADEIMKIFEKHLRPT